MSDSKISTHRNKNFTLLDTSLILDDRMSLEAIGAYGMIEAGKMKPEEIPPHLIPILLEVGCVKEVEE